MEKLKGLAAELNAIYAEIEQNRIVWGQALKPLINRVFRSIIKQIDLHLQVVIQDEIKNLESIQLTFGYLNSGLFTEQKNNQDALPPMVLVKKGGYLAYSQMANGKVSSYIHYPFIEGIYGDPDRILEIGVFLPADLSRKQISDHTVQFLEEIIKWEKEEKKLIGFQIYRKK